jgi:hypothetical protein
VASNPLVPTSAAPAGSSSVPNAVGLIQSNADTTGTTGALTKQLTDIYGKGTGGALSSLLENMSGVDSAVLQEYQQSLVPQEATAQANLDASLGAGGVSSNSSVAAIGNANLQAQETAAIAGESANLTQSQENLTAQILEGTEQSAQQEVSESGWNVFGQVLQDVGSVASDFMGMPGAIKPYTGTPAPTSSVGAVPAAIPADQSPYGSNSD